MSRTASRYRSQATLIFILLIRPLGRTSLLDLFFLCGSRPLFTKIRPHKFGIATLCGLLFSRLCYVAFSLHCVIFVTRSSRRILALKSQVSGI